MNTLEALCADGHISPDELEMYRYLEAQGRPDFMIGSEIEITESSYKDIQNPSEPTAPLKDRLDRIGFHYGNDELYEVISPPFSHPISLANAHAGLVIPGFIPLETTGSAPQHVSIGAPEVEGVYNDPGKILSLIDMLRLTEQLGTTTPERLMSGEKSWSRSGTFIPSSTWGLGGWQE